MVDRLMLRLDLSKREDYGLFLNIHHSALQELKVDWRAEDRDDFSSMTRTLQNDLHVLGIQTMLFQPLARRDLTSNDRLGVAYVVRGSRLGSSFLRRRVPAGFSASYLDFEPATTWAEFLRQLDTFAVKPGSDAGSEVIRGARGTFELFGSVIRQMLM